MAKGHDGLANRPTDFVDVNNNIAFHSHKQAEIHQQRQRKQHQDYQNKAALGAPEATSIITDSNSNQKYSQANYITPINATTSTSTTKDRRLNETNHPQNHNQIKKSLDGLTVMMNNQEQKSEQHQKRHRRTTSTSHCNPLLLLTLILIASGLATKSSLFCVCDSQQQETSSNEEFATSIQTQNQPQVAKQQQPDKQQSKRYKDKLITYLSDEIERKHLSLLNPTGSRRPSKFDSGQQEIDFIQLDSSNQHQQNHKATVNHILEQHNNYNSQINQQHLVTSSNGNNNNNKRSPSGSAHMTTGYQQLNQNMAMNDILRMHEFASLPKQQANANQDQHQQTSSNKRSRAINPVRLITSIIGTGSGAAIGGAGGPTVESTNGGGASSSSQLIGHKLMSSLLNTYISPYILGMSQAKLTQYADPSTIDLMQKQQGSEQQDFGQASSESSSTGIISNLVGGRRSKSGFKFPENPLKMLIGAGANNNPHHRPSNYHKSTTSTTLSPLEAPSNGDHLKDPMELAESSLQGSVSNLDDIKDSGLRSVLNNTSAKSSTSNNWIKNSMMGSLVQGSLRDILALTQLPIGGPGSGSAGAGSGARPNRIKKVSTAPSILESNSKHKLTNQEMALGSRIVEELLRFAYILSSGVRTKRDPYVALVNSPIPSTNPSASNSAVGSSSSSSDLISGNSFSQRSTNPFMTPIGTASGAEQTGLTKQALANYRQKIRSILENSSSASNYLLSSHPVASKARPRGIMWEMATDPSLAVTVFHLLEKASFAVPLGFLLMPFVKMIRSPLAGLDFGRLLPPRASHRSVELEELAKRLDLVDKMLSRALRPSHRDATFMLAG